MDESSTSTDYFKVAQLVLLNTDEYYTHLTQHYVHEE